MTSRVSAFALLAAANLFWAGNWVTGRALRDAFDPISLNFWRWVIATLVLAPFALPALRGKGALLRQNAGMLLFLSLSGVAVFQTLVYLAAAQHHCGQRRPHQLVHTGLLPAAPVAHRPASAPRGGQQFRRHARRPSPAS